MKIKITKIICKRCDHEWVARSSDVRRCPKCKSFYWDRKRCSKCKGTKKIRDFYSWSGNRCKDCINIWSRVYWKNHAAAASRHRKKYYTQNRDITLARHKEYYSRNPEAHRGRCQAWANANPERES